MGEKTSSLVKNALDRCLKEIISYDGEKSSTYLNSWSESAEILSDILISHGINLDN